MTDWAMGSGEAKPKESHSPIDKPAEKKPPPAHRTPRNSKKPSAHQQPNKGFNSRNTSKSLKATQLSVFQLNFKSPKALCRRVAIFQPPSPRKERNPPLGAVDPPAKRLTFCWSKGNMRGIREVKVRRSNQTAFSKPPFSWWLGLVVWWFGRPGWSRVTKLVLGWK